MSVTSGGYLPRRSSSVNIDRYSPPLLRIIVNYPCHMGNFELPCSDLPDSFTHLIFNILWAFSPSLRVRNPFQPLIVSLEKSHFTCFANGDKGVSGTSWLPWDPCQKCTAHRAQKLKKKIHLNFTSVDSRQISRYVTNPFISSDTSHPVWIPYTPSKWLYIYGDQCVPDWLSLHMIDQVIQAPIIARECKAWNTNWQWNEECITMPNGHLANRKLEGKLYNWRAPSKRGLPSCSACVFFFHKRGNNTTNSKSHRNRYIRLPFTEPFNSYVT